MGIIRKDTLRRMRRVDRLIGGSRHGLELESRQQTALNDMQVLDEAAPTVSGGITGARVYGSHAGVTHDSPTLVRDWELSPTLADTDVFSIAGTNDTEIRMASEGLYQVSLATGWSSADLDGTRFAQVRHLRDVGFPESGNEFGQFSFLPAASGVNYVTDTCIYVVLADDFFDVQVRQTSGSTLALSYAVLNIVRLGPLVAGMTS